MDKRCKWCGMTSEYCSGAHGRRHNVQSSAQIPWSDPVMPPEREDHAVGFVIAAAAVLGCISVRALFLLALSLTY